LGALFLLLNVLVGVMSFTIQWTGSFGPATTHRDSPIEAIRFAIEMLGKGFDNVVIVDVDRDGKAYTPAEFSVFYKDTRK
jgi:hypothetical protein